MELMTCLLDLAETDFLQPDPSSHLSLASNSSSKTGDHTPQPASSPCHSPIFPLDTSFQSTVRVSSPHLVGGPCLDPSAKLVLGRDQGHSPAGISMRCCIRTIDAVPGANDYRLSRMLQGSSLQVPHHPPTHIVRPRPDESTIQDPTKASQHHSSKLGRRWNFPTSQQSKSQGQGRLPRTGSQGPFLLPWEEAISPPPPIHPSPCSHKGTDRM